MEASSFESLIKRVRRLGAKGRRDLVHRVIRRPWFDVRRSDRFIVSWPRSGNTWVRRVLCQAIHGDGDWSMDEIDSAIPVVDHLDFRDRLEALPVDRPRMFKSHDPYRPEFTRGRVAYIVRDGRDALVSYHKYHCSMSGSNESLERFARRVIRGRVRYGSWHRHTESWTARPCDSVRVFRYEELLTNTEGVIQKISEHFGLGLSSTEVEQAVAATTIGKVNKSFRAWATARGKTYSGGSGGGAGGWETRLEPELRGMFLRYAAPQLRAQGYDTSPPTHGRQA